MHASSRSSRQLVADRKATYALACRRENRVAQSRRKGRHARLADAARRPVLPRRDVHVDDLRRFIDPCYGKIIEIALLRAAVLEGDLAVLGEADPHDRGAFNLRANALRIDVGAAIDCGVDAWDRYVAFIIDRDLDYRRDIAHKAAMRSDAETVALGKLASPFAFLGGELGDAAQPSGIH